jgi:glycosyltransferase involved in cell wall biosynthesis
VKKIKCMNFINKPSLLLVAHDAHPHGAQNLILNMAKIFSQDLGVNIEMVVLGGGPLLPEYEKYATLHILDGFDADGKQSIKTAKKLFEMGLRHAICNTTVTGLFVPVLKKIGFEVVTLIHELPKLIKDNNLQQHCRALAQYSDKVVFPAAQVRDGFIGFTDLDSDKVEIKPQGMFRKNKFIGAGSPARAKAKLLSRWNIPLDARCIVGIGYADYRKGIDIFIEMAMQVLKDEPETYFIWVGHWDASIEAEIKTKVALCESSSKFIFPGLDFDSDVYYAAADIYALTSREDPFPCVVLEALAMAVPVVAFDGAGGFSELLERAGGVLVPAFETEEFARGIISLLRNESERKRLGVEGQKLIDQDFSFRRYLFSLLGMLGYNLPKVSVIVPNYNYADHIARRISTVINQTFPIYELIVLDDASTDNSVFEIQSILGGLDIGQSLLVNEKNSGSVFLQWQKGIKQATGDFIWIAEADDISSPNFLITVIEKFADENVVMSYSESKQIDENDNVLAGNYQDYVSDISETKWLIDYTNEGTSEISSALAVKNTIPNASAVVFRKNSLISAFDSYEDQILSYRYAGDWLVYMATLASGGSLAFTANPLNMHRRHTSSVTIQSFGRDHLEEVVGVQNYIMNNFPVSDDVREIIKSYRLSLSEQFDVPLASIKGVV